MTVFIIIYLVGALLSSILTTGWRYAYFQREFGAIAKEQRNSDSIGAISWGICNGMLSWVGIALTFGLSKFAKHGWLAPFSESKD